MDFASVECEILRIGRAGVHVPCTCRVCAPHMLCACVGGGTACFIGTVCVTHGLVQKCRSFPIHCANGPVQAGRV
jgi:hypothetical protein